MNFLMAGSVFKLYKSQKIKPSKELRPFEGSHLILNSLKEIFFLKKKVTRTGVFNGKVSPKDIENDLFFGLKKKFEF